MMELGFIRDRQRAGIEAAKAKGATSHMHAKSGAHQTLFPLRNGTIKPLSSCSCKWSQVVQKMKRERVLDHGDVSKSAAHWRMRAEEMRTIADGAHDSTARAMMLRIAADYDRLAKHTDRKSDTVDPMMVRIAGDYHALTDCPGFMLAHDVILEPETRKTVAVIRNGQVFRDDEEGAKIATVLGSYLYDMSGNLVGYLQGGQLIDPSTQCMPIAFRNLLTRNY